MAGQAPWKHDLLAMLVIVVAGALLGLLWNPSALRESAVKVTPEDVNAAWLQETPAVEVEQGLRSGDLVVLDARQRTFYTRGHVRGALPIWDNQAEFLMRDIKRLVPLGMPVVVADEEASGYGGRRIAGLLAQAGYRQVSLLSGGVRGWRSEGRPMATGWDFEEFRGWGRGR